MNILSLYIYHLGCNIRKCRVFCFVFKTEKIYSTQHFRLSFTAKMEHFIMKSNLTGAQALKCRREYKCYTFKLKVGRAPWYGGQHIGFWSRLSAAQNFMYLFNYPPVSEARRGVANLTERKNPHTPVFICYI